MNQEYEAIVDEMLLKVGQQRSSFIEEEVTLYMPAKGTKSKRNLMIVGQAANGWTAFTPPCKELLEPGARKRLIEEARADSPPGGVCPMDWVSGKTNPPYDYTKSGFWRVARLLANRLIAVPGDMEEWPSHLIYSNLCKVAPGEGGRNPSNPLCEIQLEACRRLFELELLQYQPERIVFMTGGWLKGWFFNDTYKGRFSVNYSRGSSEVIKAKGVILNDNFSAKLVEIRHPARKPEGVSEVEIARRVERAFETIQ